MPEKRRLARIWLGSFTGLCVLLFAGLLIFNIHYDPYLVLASSEALPDEMNGGRIALSSYSYFAKAAQIIRERPDAILLGTSVTDGGFRTPGAMVNYFSPDREAYLRLKSRLAPHEEIYNAGLRGKHLAEEYEYLQHAFLNNPQLKEVYLGIDWTIFTGGGQNESLKPEVSILGGTEVTWNFLLQHLLSWSATENSWLMLHSTSGGLKDRFHDFTFHIFERNHRHMKGNGRPDDLQPEPGQDNASVLKGSYPFEVSEFAFTAWFVDGLKQSIGAILPSETAYEAFGPLKKIIAFCSAHHIHLTLFLTPKQPLYYAFMDRFGLRPYEEEWLEQLVQLAPVWDFTGAIDFSPHPESYFTTDSLHFSPAAGEIILPELLHNAPSLKGVSVMTPQNVDSAIAARRQDYAQWQATHAELMSAIQRLSPEQLATATAGQDYLALLPVMYAPDYKGFRVFRFMGRFVAVPRGLAERPSFIAMLQPEKQRWPEADELKTLLKRIDEERSHAL